MGKNHGFVWWSELATRDLKGAKDYYGKVCGWTFDEMPMDGGVYVIAKVGEHMVGGMFDLASAPGSDDVPANWMTYLAVDDVDAAVAETRSAGGT